MFHRNTRSLLCVVSVGLSTLYKMIKRCVRLATQSSKPFVGVFSEVHEEHIDPSIGERRVNFLGRLAHQVV